MEKASKVYHKNVFPCFTVTHSYETSKYLPQIYWGAYIFSPLSEKVIPLKFLTTKNADIREMFF